MSSIQVLKNGSYHSRFQVKWRRRREGKTDYFARKRLLSQDKRKYNSPKYRIVVRFSKRNIICQFVQSRLQGDHIIRAVYSRNLHNFGIKGGKTSFAASYLIGLLLAKKVLNQDFFFQGEIIGKKKSPNAILDLGLRRVTTGNKAFGVLAGITDGGIDIPHNEKRFPGFQAGENFDSSLLNERIKGKHVEEYMLSLKEEDNEKYEKHFSKLIEGQMEGDKYTKFFESCLKKIESE